MQTGEKLFRNLKRFRSQMDKSLSTDTVKYIWGRRFLKNLEKSKDKEIREEVNKLGKEENEYVKRKIQIAKKSIEKLKVFNWVKFVGVSGSVAAGFAQQDDDIDIFVVVRDGTMWLYRALVVFRNLFHNKIRAKRHKDITDKLCLNLICEERGLHFPNDIFNFHELMFLKPIYNKKYKRYILSRNKWLRKEFAVKKELLRSRVIPERQVFFLIRGLNFLAFIAQLTFMFISGHGPDVKRLRENFKKGRIEFFEYDFRIEKIKSYSMEESSNKVS